eukprot:16437861-Heterocapsa_arctica.AAC.1
MRSQVRGSVGQAKFLGLRIRSIVGQDQDHGLRVLASCLRLWGARALEGPAGKQSSEDCGSDPLSGELLPLPNAEVMSARRVSRVPPGP